MAVEGNQWLCNIGFLQSVAREIFFPKMCENRAQDPAAETGFVYERIRAEN
jgi:hypothetical protein